MEDQFFQSLARLPDRRLRQVYRFCKSRALAMPIERQTRVRLCIRAAVTPSLEGSTQDAFSVEDVRIVSAKGRRPSLHTFFKDPRAVIRLREMIRSKEQ